MSDIDPCDREVPDPGQAREPVMTETTRKLARRVTQYRRETLGWLKQAIRADGEAGEANNALIRERQIAALTKGDGHVDCAIEPSRDTAQADEQAVSDREAVLERERLVQQKALNHYERKIERLQAHATELGRTLDRTAVALSESQRALREATKPRP